MTFPAGDEKPFVVGVGPKFVLRGDFDVIAAFEGLSITPPSEAWGAGVEINVTFDDESGSRVQLERRTYPDGRQMLTAASHGRFPDGSSRIHNDSYGAASDAGVLRVSRRGHVVYFAVADAVDEPFQLLSRQFVGTADVRSETIRIVSSNAVGGVNVVWKSLIVRAEEFLHDAPAQEATLTEWSPDLSAIPLGGPLLKIPQGGGSNFVFRTADGIRMRTPTRQDSPFGVGVVPHELRIEGDFEITAEFELSRLAAPETGYGAGLELVLSLDDDQDRKLYLCRRVYHDRPDGVAVHHVWHDEDARNDSHALLETDAMAGRLRLVRRAETVSWMFADEGDAEFQTIAEETVGTAAVKAVARQCGSGSPTTGRVTVLWKKLTIRGDSITQ